MNAGLIDPNPKETVSYQEIHDLPGDVDLTKACLPISGLGKAFADKFERSKIVPALEQFRGCIQDLLRAHDALSSFFEFYMESRNDYINKSTKLPWNVDEVVRSSREALAAINIFSKKLLGDYLTRTVFADRAETLKDAFESCGEVKAILSWMEDIGDHYEDNGSYSNSNPAIVGGCLARLELAINSLLKPA